MPAIDSVRRAATRCDQMSLNVSQLVCLAGSMHVDEVYLWGATSVGNLCHILVTMHDKNAKLRVLSPTKCMTCLCQLDGATLLKAEFDDGNLLEDIVEVVGTLYCPPC